MDTDRTSPNAMVPAPSHMPELHWRFGYPLVLAVIAVACLVLHRIFVHNRWL